MKTTVDDGALQMALNVLRRAGKDEVADELASTAFRGESELAALSAEVRRLREENERLRENAKTISELEQLAARSNNELLVENERLRNDAAVFIAIDRATKELPVGDMIEITIEKDSVMVVIYYGVGGWQTIPGENIGNLSNMINHAIDAEWGLK